MFNHFTLSIFLPTNHPSFQLGLRHPVFTFSPTSFVGVERRVTPWPPCKWIFSFPRFSAFDSQWSKGHSNLFPSSSILLQREKLRLMWRSGRPLYGVHVDQSFAAAKGVAERFLGDRAEELLKKPRYQIVNVWFFIPEISSSTLLTI